MGRRSRSHKGLPARAFLKTYIWTACAARRKAGPRLGCTGRNGAGNAATSGAGRRFFKAWTWLVDGMAALGTILIGVLMLVICADVVARNLMGSSLPLVSELGALLLVMIVYLQLATTLRHDRMPRSDFLLIALERNSPLRRRIIRSLFDVVTALSLGVIAWSTLGILGKGPVFRRVHRGHGCSNAADLCSGGNSGGDDGGLRAGAVAGGDGSGRAHSGEHAV